MTTILIVEDERNLSRLTRRNLEEEGYCVLQAPDGPSALQTAADTAPDPIILDIMLPGMAGLEVCRGLWWRSEGRKGR